MSKTIQKAPANVRGGAIWQQDSWRWCHKCEGLFYNGNNTYGVCPAGGTHSTSASGEYFLSVDPTTRRRPSKSKTSGKRRSPKA